MKLYIFIFHFKKEIILKRKNFENYYNIFNVSHLFILTT